MPVEEIRRLPPKQLTPSAHMVEGFMYFFNAWLVFVILHLGKKYTLTDVISRFIHEPLAEGILLLSVVMGISGWVFRFPFVRFMGNTISTFWWGTVWMLFLLHLHSILNLGFAIYGLPLIVSVAIMLNNFRFQIRLSRDKKNNRQRVRDYRPGGFAG